MGKLSIQEIENWQYKAFKKVGDNKIISYRWEKELRFL